MAISYLHGMRITSHLFDDSLECLCNFTEYGESWILGQLQASFLC